MPYVSISAKQHISDDQAEKLQQEIGRIMPILPEKNIDNTLIQISGDRKTFMSGKSVDATFCEVRIFGKAPKEKKKEFFAELNKIITAELGDQYSLYINILELFEWGAGQDFID